MLFLLPAAAMAEGEDEQKKPLSDANITGHVEHARTLEHLPYITITVKGTNIGTTTDATGHYFLKNLPAGDITIVASALGYKTAEQKITMVAKKNMEVNFLLEEESVSMDEVVISATRNEVKKRESAVVVNVASTKLFESTASSTLAETMNFQPGLRVENNCGNCGVTQLRINGLDGQYSQILLDSRPIFGSLANMYGLDLLPLSMIERVEVIRGGGSALFGSSAIGGVVNIITKDPLRNTLSLSNTTNIFENGKTDVNTSLNGSFVSDNQKAGVYIFGMVRDRQPYDRNGDGFSDLTKITSETIGFRGYYKTSANSRLTAEYHRIHEFRRGGDNVDRPPHEAMIAEQLNHKINGGGLKYDFHTPGLKHMLSIYTSAQKIDRESYFGTDMNMDSYGTTKDLTLVAGGQYTYRMDRLLFMPAELTAGLEYNRNELRDDYLGLDRHLEQDTFVYGGFLQNEWRNEKLSFLLGARLDKHNLMESVVFSPRANIRYSPNQNIGLRASYSSGYRAPQTYNEDLHIDAVAGVLSLIHNAPGLKPEYSHSVSLSADLYHNFGRLQTNLLVEGFYTSLQDVFALVQVGIDDDGNFEMERRNESGATVAGMNLEAKLGIPGIFEVQLGYTYQQSRYKEPFTWAEDSGLEPQRRMFRSPDSYGYFTSDFTITRQFRASLFGNYTGPMLVQHVKYDYDTDTETNLQKTTRSFFDLGVKLAYVFPLSMGIDLEVNAGVRNIFDSFQSDLDSGSRRDSAYVYGPSLPRMFFVGLKFSM